jgi:Na+-transporting methylmalonyl-CoA/oxaloacetate decarboxylase gamma subunit
VAIALELAGMGLQLLSLIAFLLQFVWAIFQLVNLFTCYMYICPEGDEDMERKPSKFAFVNEMREKMDERDRLAREKDAAAREKRNQNKHKKKKK